VHDHATHDDRAELVQPELEGCHHAEVPPAAPQPPQPVWRYLAVVRAARDFGLGPEDLEPLALRFSPDPGWLDPFAEAVADAILTSSSYTSR
jgi:hypothetical protein